MVWREVVPPGVCCGGEGGGSGTQQRARGDRRMGFEGRIHDSLLLVVGPFSMIAAAIVAIFVLLFGRVSEEITDARLNLSLFLHWRWCNRLKIPAKIEKYKLLVTF